MAKKSKKENSVKPDKKQKKDKLSKLKKAIKKLKIFESALKLKEEKLDKKLQKSEDKKPKKIKDKKIKKEKDSAGKTDKKKAVKKKTAKKKKAEKKLVSIKKKQAETGTPSVGANKTNAGESARTVGKRLPKPIRPLFDKSLSSSETKSVQAKSEISKPVSTDFNVRNAELQIRKIGTVGDLESFVKGDERITVKKAVEIRLKSLKNS